MVQPIQTPAGEKLVFKRIYAAARHGSVGILQNGTWCHFPSGNPMEKEAVIAVLEAAAPLAVRDFEAYWERRQALAEIADGPQAREIKFSPDGTLLYADTGAEVQSREDIYAWFPPKVNGMLNFALTLFDAAEKQRQIEREEALLSLNTPAPLPEPASTAVEEISDEEDMLGRAAVPQLVYHRPERKR